MQTLFQCGDQCIALGLNLVFYSEDFLPLATLLGFSLADILLNPLRFVHAQRHASLPFETLEFELGILQCLLR